MHHIAILRPNVLQVPIANLAPAVDVAEQDEPEPHQQVAPPTVFATGVFDVVSKLEDQEVNDPAQVTEAAAVEAEPMLNKVIQTRTARDLALTLAQRRRQELVCRRPAARHSEWIEAPLTTPHPRRKAP